MKHTFISKSHELAKELLRKEDGFITVTIDGAEYMIDHIKRVSTHANMDDYTTNWTLCANNKCCGNIKR